MTKKTWSAKDLVNKWKRKLPEDVIRSLPWDVLKTLTENLSGDTLLPIDCLHGCIRTQDVGGLFEITASFDVTKYTSADLLLQDRLVVDLFSKFDFVNSPFNKREKAKFKFFEAEEMCRETNFQVSRNLDLSNDVNAVIHTAIRHIEKVLGRFDVNEILTSARFGPGASLCVKGKFTSEYFKLRCKDPTVSTEAFPYVEALLAWDRCWAGYLLGISPLDICGSFSPILGEGVELTIADYNKATFVPKNAKTERSIAIEPYFNVYFQLGVGGMIRRRLTRYGINLDSQLRNQALAQLGSIDGTVATIDFSMASDTIARETVRLLLPPAWFEHLDRLRSKSFLMDGILRPYEKFSSMGNGFTFELETLIFYALAWASCEVLGLTADKVSVFGDDVILPTPAVSLYEEATRYLGFKINEEKSFSTGQFRESCGEDFLGGHRVRPVFCKELWTVQHVVSLANRLSALNRAVGAGSRIDNLCRAADSVLMDRVPRDIRRLVVGPPSENVDGYIHTDDLATLTGSELVRWDHRLYAWRHPIIRFAPTKLDRRDDAVALFVQHGLSAEKHKEPLKIEPRYLSSLLASYGERSLQPFIRENVAREITGRKVGRMVLGSNLVWSLGGTGVT